jgi:phosphate-selective porin OprO/OprP
VRIGKAKTPFGLERLQSASALLFVERGFPTALVPNRDLGIQVFGDVAQGVVSYAASLTNGVADGGSADIDTNEGKDAAARLMLRPLARNAQNPLSGLAVGIAGSTGDQPLALPVIRTAAQQVFFSYAPGTTGAGRRVRVSPQGSFYVGPFGAFAEYVTSTGDVQRLDVAREIEARAWQIAASWVLTGEPATDRGVRPRRNFDPQRGGPGAVQVAVRYHVLRLDEDVVTFGLAAAGASREAEAVGVGVNWYLNPFVKWAVNVDRTVFDGDADGPRRAENALLFRGQLAF